MVLQNPGSEYLGRGNATNQADGIPQVRQHPNFGEVTFVEFGAMLMQSMPQASAEVDFSRTVRTEWVKLPIVQASQRSTPRVAAPADHDGVIVHAGTDPGPQAPSGASESGLSRRERLQQSRDLGEPRSNTPEPRSIVIPPAPMMQFTRNDIISSLRCNRRSVSEPRTQPIQPMVTTPRDNAESLVASIQGTAAQLTATAAAVAAPVLLAGGTIVAGGATGAVLGNAVMGEMAAETLGNWAVPAASLLGKAGGAIAGTSLTNTAMSVAASCQRRDSRAPRRVPPVRRPAHHSMDSAENSGSEYLGRGNEANQAHQIEELRAELLKLKHLDDAKRDEKTKKASEAVRADAQHHSSAERRIVERQDALESQLVAMRPSYRISIRTS